MRSRERKLDDAIEAPQKENACLKRDAKKLVADLEGVQPFINAAISWWAHKRPLSWSLLDHIKNPEVNCVGPVERHLALMVCELERRSCGRG
jgi:hypothetical protein